jgi:uncharacterized protein
MIAIISPAKTFKPQKFRKLDIFSQPVFWERSQQLARLLAQKSPIEIQSLMGVSERIADLNFGRYQNFPQKLNLDNAKQALLSFYGDVYRGISADSFGDEQLQFCDHHLRILSGLYGLLRPLDLIAEYRLEMGMSLAVGDFKNLSAFWRERVTERLKKDLRGEPLINLASQEYFSAVDSERLEAPIITPVFRQLKNGGYKTIPILAKRARGLMVRFMVDRKIVDVKGLRDFDLEGYRWSAEASTTDQWIFQRSDSF